MGLEEYLVEQEWKNDWVVSLRDEMEAIMNKFEIQNQFITAINSITQINFQHTIFRKYKSKSNFSRNFAIILKSLII